MFVGFWYTVFFSSAVAFTPSEEIRFIMTSKGFNFRQTIILEIINNRIVTPKVIPMSDQYFSILLYRKDNWNQRNNKEPDIATGTNDKINPSEIDIR